MILLLYHLSPLYLHEHIFVLNFSVTSEHFKSGILIFYLLYYSYDFSFSDQFFWVFIFGIYKELTWHVYLINLFNKSFYSLTQSIYLSIYVYITFWPYQVACGILVTQRECEPVLLQWKLRDLNHWISREIPNTWHVFSLLVYLINLFFNEGYLLCRICWFLPNINMNQP